MDETVDLEGWRNRGGEEKKRKGAGTFLNTVSRLFYRHHAGSVSNPKFQP